MRPRRSSKRAKTKTKSLVNWLDLPRDVTIQIFIKIGTIELLYNAQRVCSFWRAIAKDPQLYRSVDLRNQPWRYFDDDSKSFETAVKMARLAIDRGLGQTVEFSIDYFCTDGVLYDLVNKAPLLKCLRITNGEEVEESCVVEVVQKLPWLEEVEFTFCWFCHIDELVEAVGLSCRKLKSFGMNGPPERLSPEEADEEGLNKKAVAIAVNLNPGLKSLRLLGDSMNNDGLEAILQRFTHLEYLDLRLCTNLDLKGDLLKKCQEIKMLRLPNDSIMDCPLPVGDYDWMLDLNTRILDGVEDDHEYDNDYFEICGMDDEADSDHFGC